MRIRRLDITGFKSFMDRAVFTFDEGVTGVVGPNGCGKSNVVDAIRWVMGEQSAKHLRGRGMEDVIFNGSESKPPLSMAEVSLTFEVDPRDQLAPQYAGFGEVTVTRRLFRSGESEYLINRTQCRLLDVVELFLGTGVGTRAYSIIEQGRVGLIVSAKPEDRRSIIEEAAGVTKYKSRRKAAERKMEATEGNLLRVADLVAELEKRLDSLGRQAKKAEKYRSLKARIREIELHQASHKLLGLLAEQKHLQESIAALGETEQAALHRVRALEDEVEARRARLEADGQRLQTLADEVHALDSQTRETEQALSFWRADLAAAQAAESAAAAEGEALGGRHSALETRRAALEAEVAALTGAFAADEAAMRRAQEGLDAAQGLQKECKERLDQERLALLGLAGRIANQETQLTALAARREELRERHRQALAELHSVRGQESALDRERNEVTRRVQQSRQLTLELAERRGAEEDALAAHRAAFAESEVSVISLREELADKRSRLHSLEEIQRHYEGFDRGVRAVMLRAGAEARAQGIFGLVADVLRTSPRFERAIEAALGARLQNVLVQSRSVGLELSRYLASVAEGRSSFLPVPELAVAPPPPVPEGLAGVLGRATDEVHAEPEFRPVLELLLGNVLLVEDLDAATRVRDLAPGFSAVTLAGEVLAADGTLTGGVLEGPGSGALQKKREIAELAETVAATEARYNELLTRHYALQKQILHTEELLKGLQKHHHEEELVRSALEKDLHQASEQLARFRERITQLVRDSEALDEQLARVDRDEEAARGESAHAQAERASREERARDFQERLEGLERSADAHGQELMALRVKVASHAERAEAARSSLAEVTAGLAELVERQARAEEARAQALARREELQGRIASAEEGHAGRLQQLTEGTARLEEGRHAHGEEVARVRADETSLRDERARLDGVTEGLGQITLRERSLVLEVEHLVRSVEERHQTDLGVELHRFHTHRLLQAGEEQQLRELRGQLERLGEINLTAIEEHAEVGQRHSFLAGQKKDLESSIKALRDAIAKIDRTSRERFTRTFEVVNDRFQRVFPRLFGGGRAGLLLTDEGPTGEPGVEIVAQPPGKKLQSVTLLSGGEKALTAVALIFAIFLIKPTPFCLLDEVDAPLDEGNVGRYNDLLREMCKQSQFILITHNKRTMEVVDTLYGVTMEEPGISKLVSVRLRDATAANDDQAVA
ncbi:MAG: chromosome segregation protein SMC [Myxococcaceae bacterium]|nr:MAG: chromosome segregation protein SMC [Myxococcaceae bacterium]